MRTVTVPEYRVIQEKSIYADVLGHSQQAPFGDQHGRSTNVHETAHGIHSEIRNREGRGTNAFYLLNGQAAVLNEPPFTMRDVAAAVPTDVRSLRWSLYMEQQAKQWNSTPLYICDEWVAYVLGGACGVEDVREGRYQGGWTDGVMGLLEFSIYATALGVVAKEKGCLEPDLKEFLSRVLAWAELTYLHGFRMEEFRWDRQDQLLQAFQTSPQTEGLRAYLRDEAGLAWLGWVASESPVGTAERVPTFCSCPSPDGGV